MNLYSKDTIAAVCTPPGEGGVAIVRISGPDAGAIADRIFRCSAPLPSERKAGTFVYGHVADPDSGFDIDEAILLTYRAPASYTGEDVVEIQSHAGRIAVSRVLEVIINAGARIAEPGEFTKRAFLNGRIDLLQAEAVCDMITAGSDRALSAAVEQLEGHLSSVINSSYDEIMAIAADLAATFDFDDDELPSSVMEQIRDRLIIAADGLHELLKSSKEGRILREGLLTVIAGEPNVGKSTLMNRLLGTERAIVTHHPGTTRDIIEEQMIIGGIPVRLVDTAGLRDADCEIEREGIQRAKNRIKSADVIIRVIDASKPLSNYDRDAFEGVDKERFVVVLNKCDIGNVISPDALQGLRTVECSLRDGSGLASLKKQLFDIIGISEASTPHAVISVRHRQNIQNALNALNKALAILTEDKEDLLPVASDEMRDSLEHLGRITGRVYEDDLLDSVFSRFCLGK